MTMMATYSKKTLHVYEKRDTPIADHRRGTGAGKTRSKPPSLQETHGFSHENHGDVQ
jgi:hypothetical protein